MRRLIALLLLICSVLPALAVNPSEMLADPALEARARTVSAELRCLVCQNQSIEDSDADLAAELRVIVRERITAGDSDAEAIQYVVDRYGEFVLLRPVLGWHTLVLWGAGPVLLVAGGLGIAVALRRRKTGRDAARDAASLSAEEAGALAALEADGPPRG